MSAKSVLLITLSVNVCFIALGFLLGKSPEQYFGKEASPITWVSFFQLLTIAVLSWKTFKIRKGMLLWGIIALGFLFLSIDEVARIHENMDSFIHKKILHMHETALSDRLDDLIVGFYALIGMGTLYFYREELKKYQKAMFFLVISFILIFSMVGTELIANRFDVLPALIPSHHLAKQVYVSCKVLEEVFKLFAEAFLISTFYQCFQLAKQNVKA